MTLFDKVDRGNLYRDVLNQFYEGEEDPATLQIIAGWQRV